MSDCRQRNWYVQRSKCVCLQIFICKSEAEILQISYGEQSGLLTSIESNVLKTSTSDASKHIFVHYFQVNLLIGMQIASEFDTRPLEK